MTNDYHGDDQRGMFQLTPAEKHAERALTQAACYAADLTIARWSGAADTAIPARAAWLAHAHEGLQMWLEAGGFAQPRYDDIASASRLHDESPLPFPGSRPLLYSVFRQARSTTE